MKTAEKATLESIQKEQQQTAINQMVLAIELQITQVTLQRDLEQMEFDHHRNNDIGKIQISELRHKMNRIDRMNETLSELRKQRMEVKWH